MSEELVAQIERALGIGSMWVVAILGSLFALYLLLTVTLQLVHLLYLKIWHVEVMAKAYQYAIRRTRIKPPGLKSSAKRVDGVWTSDD